MAFVGILIMQNPFSQQLKGEDNLKDLIGSGLCILAAVTGGIAMVLIRKMGTDVHYMQSPFYFSLTSLILAPVFQGVGVVTINS